MNQIMNILITIFFGKYYFEVAIVLRSSLFLNSILLNSEAWGYLTNKNIRSLEQMDEALLSRILDCERNTSNTFKYLELGIYPIRFEIMKRSIVFLHYILKQEESSMMFQVLKATIENPTKNDFVNTCLGYLEILEIKMTLQEIKEMSEGSFKQLVKNRTKIAAFKYLLKEKEKQSKIANIFYEKLEIQEYLNSGQCSTKISKLIFKARSETLDIKTQRKWKYADRICIGCKQNEETGQEILVCEKLNDENRKADNPINYTAFVENDLTKIVKAAKLIEHGLKQRQLILEIGIT